MVFRRRLIFWLAKEYIKKWGKTIIFFFLIGLGIFFILWSCFLYFKPTIPKIKKESIGIVGAYTPDTLPSTITDQLGVGLTKVAPDGKITPGLAQSWVIKNNGRTYEFHLKKDKYFTNNKHLTSNLINYNFSDATVQRPDAYTIIFTLKDTYSPFLTTVSKPVFIDGYIGVGKYRIKNIELNGPFVQSIDLVPLSNAYDVKNYQFYPTADALKTAFLLGEITEAKGLPDNAFRNVALDTFHNTSVQQGVNTSQLVTLFYNTKDNFLSERDARVGLTYALPDVFPQGIRAYTFYPKSSWMYSPQYIYTQDVLQAKKLTESLRSASKSASLTLSIKTLAKYEDSAEIVKKAWEKIGVSSIIEVVDTIPSDFQVFLGDYNLPKDPDQYMLWHSRQTNNITHYESKRIDKLLEDARKTTNFEQRKTLYADLQKYLLADAPAAFLYFPNDFTITRK